MNNPIQEEIDAKATAPRVTPADIEANIVDEHYFRAAEGAVAAWQKTQEMEPPDFTPLRRLTFCVLVLRNGHTVSGESHCQDPAKFDAEIGRAEARKDAIRKLWPMVVYERRSKLNQE
jgi:hypothetical protein